MIRNDFQNSGFPVNRRNPVIGYKDDGTVKVAYNRYDLRQMVVTNNIVGLVGIWTGAKNSDVFPLDIKDYSGVPVPPEEDKEIDSSPEVVVKLSKGGEFRGVAYLNIASEEKTLSKNEAVYSYLKKTGMTHRVINED